MKMPTAARMKNITFPVAPVSIWNKSRQYGDITPGYPKISAPGQNMAAELPTIATIPLLVQVIWCCHLLSAPRARRY